MLFLVVWLVSLGFWFFVPTSHRHLGEAVVLKWILENLGESWRILEIFEFSARNWSGRCWSIAQNLRIVDHESKQRKISKDLKEFTNWNCVLNGRGSCHHLEGHETWSNDQTDIGQPFTRRIKVASSFRNYPTMFIIHEYFSHLFDVRLKWKSGLTARYARNRRRYVRFFIIDCHRSP